MIIPKITSPNHTTVHIPAVIYRPLIEKHWYVDNAMLYYITLHSCYNNIKYIFIRKLFISYYHNTFFNASETHKVSEIMTLNTNRQTAAAFCQRHYMAVKS